MASIVAATPTAPSVAVVTSAVKKNTVKWVLIGLAVTVVVGIIFLVVYFMVKEDKKNTKTTPTTTTKSPGNPLPPPPPPPPQPSSSSSSGVGKFDNIRKLTVRRFAAAGDNHVDFYELTIKDNNGVVRNPQAGQIYPRAWIGEFSNLFDGNHSTRWHTWMYTGGFVNETTAQLGFIQVTLQTKRKGICERFHLGGQHPSEIH